MALRKEEWLHLAQKLAVGGTSRHYHGRERRPNLQVGNESDRWWAYCQACKQGAVQKKEHVLLTGRRAPIDSCSLTKPFDMQRLENADESVQSGVVGFLASKCMDLQYLPDVWFSKSRCRIMLAHGAEWLGRDTTDNSPQKWLTYDNSVFLADPEVFPCAVVVEDPFSFFKIRWAMRGQPVSVYSSLGTRLNDKLLLRLLKHEKVQMFYDGDAAGVTGAAKEALRLRSCGVDAVSAVAPDGMDPKDMSVLAIQQHVGV